MHRRFIFKDASYIIKSRIKRRNQYKKSNKTKGFFIIVIIVMIFIWSFTAFENKIKPTVITIAQAQAKVIAINAINEAVNQEIVNKVRYEDLIILKKDQEGRVSALQTNIVKMNEMQALTVSVFQDKLSKIESSELSIPIGNIFNSSILAGWGPKIKIKIIPIGVVQSKFVDDIVTAGINQTKHKISMDIKGMITVVVPFISTSAEVVTNVPVAETIIVGNVPVTYLDVSSDASDEEKKRAMGIAENLATMEN